MTCLKSRFPAVLRERACRLYCSLLLQTSAKQGCCRLLLIANKSNQRGRHVHYVIDRHTFTNEEITKHEKHSADHVSGNGLFPAVDDRWCESRPSSGEVALRTGRRLQRTRRGGRRFYWQAGFR